jgi:signal transduction histidine kinase
MGSLNPHPTLRSGNLDFWGIAVKRDEVPQVTERELASLTFLANVGELAGPVAHVFNNFLNTVLLHMAVLEMQLKEELKPELAEVRKQARHVELVVKQLQQYRHRQQIPLTKTDLNQAIHEFVADLQEEAKAAANPIAVTGATVSEAANGDRTNVNIHLQLDARPALVPASHVDLTRLCSFLVRNALAAISEVGGTVFIRTGSMPDKTLLWIEDDGPSLSPELLRGFFEPIGGAREGVNGLELAACESLARRLQGRIGAENRSGGGVSIRVELPT